MKGRSEDDRPFYSRSWLACPHGKEIDCSYNQAYTIYEERPAARKLRNSARSGHSLAYKKSTTARNPAPCLFL